MVLDRWEKLKQNLVDNIAVWMGIWILVLLNIFVLITMGYGFKWGNLILCILIGIAGIMGLLLLIPRSQEEGLETEEVDSEIGKIMEEIRPLCDELFVQEINRITQPVIEEIREDYKRGLSWLWEDSQAYLQRLQEGVSEIHVIIQLVNSLSEGKMKVSQKLEENLDVLQQTAWDIQSAREKDDKRIDQSIEEKSEELKKGMEREKDLFYDYVQRLLLEQVRNREEGFDILEYLNIDKLGEQFSVVIEKSVQARLSYFEDALISDIENISADVVGRMQKGALQLLTIFKDIEEMIDLLIDEFSGENSLATRRLRDSQHKVKSLKEQANELMVSLAWQDILLEKRWLDIEERLVAVKDQVLDNVSEDVVQYLGDKLQEDIPVLNNLVQSPANMLLYKSLLDAEIVYQVYEGDKMPELLESSYALLLFIRPIEDLAVESIRLKEAHLSKKRNIKEQIKKGEFDAYWQQVMDAVERDNAELLRHLEDIYPRQFYYFCNSPYIKKRPDNLNQAAWMLFLRFLDQDVKELDEAEYLLLGVLLCIYQLRNSCIHPLKSAPLPLENQSDLADMRYCAHRAIGLLLQYE